MSKSNRPAGAVAAKRRSLASLAIVAGAVAAGAMLSAGAEARSQAAPANVTPPAISGTAVVAETLTASPGSWTGTAPLSFAFAWQRCNAAGASCAPIGGATGTTYVAVTDDVGSTLRVEVTVTNSEGSASSLSAQTAVVTQPTVPVNTAEPLISGSPVEGIDAQHHDRHVGRPVDHVRVPVGALRHRAEGSPTARTARRSHRRRAPATRSRPTTSGVGSASR